MFTSFFKTAFKWSVHAENADIQNVMTNAFFQTFKLKYKLKKNSWLCAYNLLRKNKYKIKFSLL